MSNNNLSFRIPLSVTILPTRKCNLNCAYCKIRNQNFVNELDWKRWIMYIRRLNKKIGSICFWILLGGEITTWGEDLIKFVKEISKTEIPWNFTTNGVLLTKEFLFKLRTSGLKSISVSLDSLKPREDFFENLKSQRTIQILDRLNKYGFKDLHCTITVDRTNLEELPQLIKFLTSKKTYSEITPLIFGKSPAYDYAGSHEELKDRLFTEKDKDKILKIMTEVIKMKKFDYLIHNTDYYLFHWANWGIRQDWKCGYPTSLVFDADGSARLCLHIKGKRAPKHNIKNFDYKRFLLDWYQDYEELCQGCYWNCQFEPAYIYGITKKVELVKKYFMHQVQDVES